jgi:hypothetical protein
LDSLVTRSDDTGSHGNATGTKRLGTVPPGLTRGIRLSAEKNRDPTSEDLFELYGGEGEAMNPVMTFVPCGFFVLMDLQQAEVPSDALEKQHFPVALSGQPADIDHLLPVTVPITPDILNQATKLTS